MEYTIKTLQGKREKLEVVIYTQTSKITGNVHTMPASRLVDFMNSKAGELFIVVTGASVYSLPDERMIRTADFFVLNRKAIMMVFPASPGSPVTPEQPGRDAQNR